jgi:TrmH family RNA methyltransferase
LKTLLTSREIKELQALKFRRKRGSSGRFVAEGVRVVEDLLASRLTVVRVIVASSVEDNARGAALMRLCQQLACDLRVIADHEFASLAATEAPQGVIAIAEIPSATLGEVAADSAPAVVLVLDAVQDPGNFGTLVRSAEALGARAVVALPGTVDPWNPKAVRAAAGSAFRLPIVQANWPEVVRVLRAGGFELWGAAMQGYPITGATADRVALVVGNEGAGLSLEVLESLDRLVSVPTRGSAESLNVAAAAAILLYELVR